MRNEVRKVELLSEVEAKNFNLTKKQALKRLKEARISESEQMLVKWCRDREIDAVRIFKGEPSNRGLRISEASLEEFIILKTANALELFKTNMELNEQLEKVKEENSSLKEQVIKLKEECLILSKKKEHLLQNFLLSPDKAEASFKYKNSTYRVLFDIDNGEVIQVKKKGRGLNFIDITKKLEDELKTNIENKRKSLLEFP